MTPEQRKQKRQHERHRQQYRRYRIKKRLQLAAGAACIVVLLIAGISAGTSLLTAGGVSTDESVSQMESTPKPTITPQEPSPTPAPEESQASQAEPTPTPPESTAAPTEGYVYSQPVPKSDKVETSYFDDAVFIGDSRTQGFILYSGLANTTAYAGKGLAVNKISTDAVVTENGQDYTVSQALENHSGEFKKVYLMFGVNELGWSYPEKFKESYQQVVEEVKVTQPDATIYVQSILPVSKEKSNSSDVYNMERVNLFNGLLQEMAEEEGVIYLDVASSVTDSEGYLPEDASTDGVHLNKAYCQIWLQYLEEHTAE